MNLSFKKNCFYMFYNLIYIYLFLKMYKKYKNYSI